MRKLIVIDHENIIKVFGHIVGLKAEHFILLEYMTKFALTNAKVISSDGVNYYWVAHNKAVADMILFFSYWKDNKRVPASKRTLIRITAELEKAGLIYKYSGSQKEGKSYYGFSDTVIKFFSPHVRPTPNLARGYANNGEGTTPTLADNSKLIDSKLNDSITLGSTTFFSELFAKLETTYLQQFVEQPSKTWLKEQQKKYTAEEIEDIFTRVEAWCVEHTGYCKKRKNLGRVFTQFAKDLKKNKDVDVPAYVLEGFTNFYKAKRIDLDAANTSNTTKQKMHAVAKKVAEHYKTKLDAKKVTNFLALVKKELWYDSKTSLYNVAYLLNKTAEAIATLPKKKKATPRKKSLQLNKFVSTFLEQVKMDKHLDLEEKHQHHVRKNIAFLISALGATGFTSVEQVKNLYSAFLSAYTSGKFADKKTALNYILTNK